MIGELRGVPPRVPVESWRSEWESGHEKRWRIVESAFDNPSWAGGVEGPLEAFVLATLRRLELKDRQLRNSVETLHVKTEQANQLQRGLEDLQSLRSAGHIRDGDGDVGPMSIEYVELRRPGETLPELVERLNSTYGFELQAERNDDRKWILRGEFIDAAIQETNSRLTRLNSSNELDMINLQSLLESRSNELRIISQILNGEHETLRSVIANIAR